MSWDRIKHQDSRTSIQKLWSAFDQHLIVTLT
uniref:Uncharacterized protein n=1 Tax=Anguilla anguilla TaxID=7936 RepID=A0A0E9R8V6_ANGAN